MKHSLITEVEQLTHAYVSKGGKDNRKQQRSRMLEFAEHAAILQARSMGQVGGKHVISYWKAKRDLQDTTLRSHWYSLCTLWALAGKQGKPPQPKRQKPTLKEKLFGKAKN